MVDLDFYAEIAGIKLNGAASWDSNPEVRVVEFSVAEVSRG